MTMQWNGTTWTDHVPPPPIKKERVTPEDASRRGWALTIPTDEFPGFEYIRTGAALRAAESLEAIYTRVGRVEATTNTIRQFVMSSAVERQSERDAVADGLLRVYKAFRRADTRPEQSGEWANRPIPLTWKDWKPLLATVPVMVRRAANKYLRSQEDNDANTFGDMAELTADDWMELPGVGPATCRKIMEWLAEHVNTGPSPP